MHVPLGFTRGKGAHSKGVAGACFGRECSVHVPLGSAKPFGAQRPRFARGKGAHSKRLREVCPAELQECLAGRRVWRLRFKLDVNIDVIDLSRSTYLSFERAVEKSSNARRGISYRFFQKGYVTLVGCGKIPLGSVVGMTVVGKWLIRL